MVGRKFTSVIFDFDYTLADSSRGIIECVNSALHGMGLAAAEEGDIRETIGLSLPATFAILTKNQSGQHAEEFVRRFVQRADAVMVDRTVLLPFVAKVISRLSRRGMLLGIVSTKYRRRIQQVLERERLASHFKSIVGGEDVTAHKPDPSGLLHAVKQLNQAPPDALYVGDSVVDAETAERAGVAFAAVLSGVTPRDAFLSHPVCGIFDDLGAVADFLERDLPVT